MGLFDLFFNHKCDHLLTFSRPQTTMNRQHIELFARKKKGLTFQVNCLLRRQSSIVKTHQQAIKHHNNPKYWDRQASANSGDPDQMLQNAGSDQVLHCLPLSQHYFIDTNRQLTLVLLNLDIPCFANIVDPDQSASEEEVN